MRDDRIIMLIYWQEEPLGYSASAIQQCILPTAVNNHAGKHSLGTRVKPWLHRPTQTLPIDKWVCPSIEIVEIQQASYFSSGMQEYNYLGID